MQRVGADGRLVVLRKDRGADADAFGSGPERRPDVRLAGSEGAQLVGAHEELADAAAAAGAVGTGAAANGAVSGLPDLAGTDQPRQPVAGLRAALEVEDASGEVVGQRVQQGGVAGG